MTKFGKVQMEPGDRVLAFVCADGDADEVVTVGEGVYQGVFIRGDEKSKDPIDRRAALKQLLAGENVVPRILLDTGEYAWGDEVHYGDAAGGREWVRNFSKVKTITMAEARELLVAKLHQRIDEEPDFTSRPVAPNRSWRVDQPSWRCEE